MTAGASGPQRNDHWPPPTRSVAPKGTIDWLPPLRILIAPTTGLHVVLLRTEIQIAVPRSFSKALLTGQKQQERQASASPCVLSRRRHLVRVPHRAGEMARSAPARCETGSGWRGSTAEQSTSCAKSACRRSTGPGSTQRLRPAPAPRQCARRRPDRPRRASRRRGPGGSSRWPRRSRAEWPRPGWCSRRRPGAAPRPPAG